MKPPPGPSPRQWLRGPLLLLAGVLAFPLLARGDYAYLLPLGQLCGIYVVLVTGLTLLMGYTGQVSLGHAGFYGFGAYVAAVMVTAGQAPLWLAIPTALAAGALLAFGSGFMVLRLRGPYLALATLCLGVILVDFINKSKITGGAAGLFDLPEITLGGWLIGNPTAKFWFVWSVAGLVILWATHLTASPVGRALKAIHGDEEAALSMGIDVFSVKLKIFVISGVLAALAGVLYAFVYSPSYLGPEEFSLMFSVSLVTMVVIGGMGSIWGGLAGAMVVTGMNEAITLVAGKLGLTDVARFQQLIFGLLLVNMLIFCPRGLAPALPALWGRWRPRRKFN